MASKSALGKGLSALLPDDEDLPAGLGDAPFPANEAAPGRIPGEQALKIPLEKLKPNPYQARKHFAEDELTELADSIRAHGIINPLIAAEDAEDGRLIIVAGERRWRAAARAGLAEVPAFIRSFSPEKLQVIALIDNVQRSNLNPMEEAAAYKALMDLTGLSQDDTAARVGKSRSAVANALRLLKLPPAAREALERGALTPGHGRAILSVNSETGQERLLAEILRQGLSVRDAEKRAAALNAAGAGTAKAKPAAPGRDPELNAMEDRFRNRLGTKVAINGDMRKGSINIEYYSMDDLDRLLGLLG
ncbi:MAG: ParB/RepB/Spo0J family partition protein [Treponema sp.]|nr:ParB/RepB/Spo0J family partition protein [Treponema sp.]